ncbi:ras-specific guanine nucleotide-releasing factor RalGPS2-like [Macrosteles quadrilineatus]|uniref:ras-specific guanine nucleotide-releasing factor RalGPS2-like n=1 Tax=Macrosteles quadrilineatus TaxID=74068 RepID=UPI0023E1C65F|nr:ras-specific guanine nucleotide-releasing factor RalGPS2-like [Macrosteles quadrilineatus]
MAKMKYSEMSRDISCDSLSTLRLIEEKHEKKTRDCDIEPVTLPKNTPNKISPKKISRTSTAESISTALPCYDNLGATGVQSQSNSKSQSLPAQVSLRSMDQLVLEALRVSAEDFASQLTLLDLQVFVQITPDELVSCAWNKKNKLLVAPNVVAFTKRFNHVSFWTVQEVLSGTSPKHRAEILSHFIKIGKRLYELNNFHSLFAVVSALQSVSVYRLTKTWNLVSKKDKSTFDKLAEVFSDTDNWRNLREHMENLKLPCIPYLGVFLTDLVYIDMAHPHMGGLEPEQRKLKMNNILRIVSNLQQSQYPHLLPLPHIQRYLHSVRYIDELQKFVEDDNYKLSLRLEPPSPAPSSSSSRESVSELATVASLNLSPAKPSLRLQPVIKFVPGHRKSRSLGTKFRSTSLPRNFHKPVFPASAANGVFAKPCHSSPRNLLDNSVILYISYLVSANTLLSVVVFLPSLVTQAHTTLFFVFAKPCHSSPHNLLDDSVIVEGGGGGLGLHGHSVHLMPMFLKSLVTQAHTTCWTTLVFAKPCHSSPRNLLDDSVIEEGGGGGLGLLSHSVHLMPSLPDDTQECVTLQGCLRRKTLMKEGRKPTVSPWQRYWVQLWATALVFYLPKTFKGCERTDFKRDPCKMTPLTGCLVTLGHNPVHSDVFLIRDPHRSNMYKFKAISEEDALIWYNSLQQMLTENNTTSTNLISFD